MNTDNVKATIAIMERAKKNNSLHMSQWQGSGEVSGTQLTYDRIIAYSEEELHACGNKACLAGHTAISPEFKADGGLIDQANGAPRYPGFSYAMSPEKTMSRWFGFADERMSDLFIYPGTFTVSSEEPDSQLPEKTFFVSHLVYGCNWSDVTPDIVIEQLQKLLEIGEEEYKNLIIEKAISMVKHSGYLTGKLSCFDSVLDEISF